MKFILESIDSCSEGIRKLRLRHFDWFGNIPSFQMRGSERFQTSAGAFVTFIYVIQILSSLGFYLSMVIDKSQPNIQTNIYEGEEETVIDFIDDDVVWAFGAWRADFNRQITYEEFLENFTFYASLIHISENPSDLSLDFSYTSIPIIPCEDMKHLDYTLGQHKQYESIDMVCPDFRGIEIKPNLLGFPQFINIFLYRCQETTEDIANGVSKCKNEIEISDTSQYYFYNKKSFDLDKYENPVSQEIVFKTETILEENLKTIYNIEYQKTKIKTMTGILGRNEHVKTYVTEATGYSKSNTRSSASIKYNYASTGKLVFEDCVWQMHIKSIKTIKVMTRSYFTAMEMFSDMGGIFECLTVLTFLFYSFYNTYRVKRYIIQKNILGKSNVLPEKYDIKNDFADLAYRKKCPCCFKRSANKDLLDKKREVYDNCNQIISEKLDLANYLNDSMNFHATSHLLLKSRHRFLVPLLTMHLTSKSKKHDIENKSIFFKNLYKRIDQPVFSVEDAIMQIKKRLSDTSYNELNTIEKCMDEFFLTNLPRDIIDLHENKLEKANNRHNDINANKILMFSEQYVHARLDETSEIPKIQPIASNKIVPIDPNDKKNKILNKEKSNSAPELSNLAKISDTNNSILKRLEIPNDLNKLKRRRKSFIDEIINSTVERDKNNFVRSKTMGASAFKRSISLIQQNKRKLIVRKNDNQNMSPPTPYNMFDIKSYESTPANNESTPANKKSSESCKKGLSDQDLEEEKIKQNMNYHYTFPIIDENNIKEKKSPKILTYKELLHKKNKMNDQSMDNYIEGNNINTYFNNIKQLVNDDSMHDIGEDNFDYVKTKKPSRLKKNKVGVKDIKSYYNSIEQQDQHQIDTKSEPKIVQNLQEPPDSRTDKKSSQLKTKKHEVKDIKSYYSNIEQQKQHQVVRKCAKKLQNLQEPPDSRIDKKSNQLKKNKPEIKDIESYYSNIEQQNQHQVDTDTTPKILQNLPKSHGSSIDKKSSRLKKNKPEIKDIGSCYDNIEQQNQHQIDTKIIQNLQKPPDSRINDTKTVQNFLGIPDSRIEKNSSRPKKNKSKIKDIESCYDNIEQQSQHQIDTKIVENIEEPPDSRIDKKSSRLKKNKCQIKDIESSYNNIEKQNQHQIDTKSEPKIVQNVQEPPDPKIDKDSSHLRKYKRPRYIESCYNNIEQENQHQIDRKSDKISTKNIQEPDNSRIESRIDEEGSYKKDLSYNFEEINDRE